MNGGRQSSYHPTGRTGTPNRPVDEHPYTRHDEFRNPTTGKGGISMPRASAPHSPQSDVDAQIAAATANLNNGGLAVTAQPAATPVAINGGKFAGLWNAAEHSVAGASLETDKTNLIGVPFVITSVTYRDGIQRNKQATNYVSVEAVVADANTLAKLVKMGRLVPSILDRVIPEESIVFNDGGTGIPRQLTAFLHRIGMIEVPDGPENGPSGECRYDTYRANWLRGNTDGSDPRFEILLKCERGLRVSEYTTPEFGDSSSFYIG